MSPTEALIEGDMLLDELLVGLNGWHETADGCACCAHEAHGCCGASGQEGDNQEGCAAACPGDGRGELHEAPKHLPPVSLAPDEDSYAGGSRDELEPEWREFCKHTHEILSNEGKQVPKCSHFHVRVHRSAIEKRQGKKVPAPSKSAQTNSATEVQDDSQGIPNERKRNREAVRNYRARKKAYLTGLEEEVERLREENQGLRYQLRAKESVEAEYSQLKALVANVTGLLSSCMEGSQQHPSGYYPSNASLPSTQDVFRLPMTTMHLPGCDFGKSGEPQRFPSCPGGHCPTNIGQQAPACPSGTDTQRGSFSQM